MFSTILSLEASSHWATGFAGTFSREKVIWTITTGGENFSLIAFLTHFKESRVKVLYIKLSFPGSRVINIGTGFIAQS